MAQVGASLWRNFRTYQIFGANTDVGKTIFSTFLCRAARSRDPAQKVWYLKPVSTGPADEADVRHIDRFTKDVRVQNFYQFNDPVSPHIAASSAISNSTIQSKIGKQIRSNSKAGSGFMLVETAGGPHSPGPSGTSQIDLYRPLRLPTILVADAKLGGISTSISSFESLKIRGFDVDGVAVFRDPTYQNYEYFQKFFAKHDIPVLSVPSPPSPASSSDIDQTNLLEYYATTEASTFPHGQLSVLDFADALAQKHDDRLSRLDNMATKAYAHIWWPFTQHTELTPQSLNVIDSAYGDYFQTYRNAESLDSAEANSQESASNLLQSSVDGSASWWTQGLGHGNHELALSAAYAAGRYGHVMFASGVHEPALALAEKVLDTLQNPRLNRVFYSDNGSTGMEVAVKMALKASCERYGWDPKNDHVDILGFKNSYHGDTIGSMDMSEPSVYNEKVPWYNGKGFWLDTPTVKMRDEVWIVEKPAGMKEALGSDTEFSSLQDVFDRSRDLTNDAAMYERYIRSTLENLTQTQRRKFGALIMEPVVLGAGGMLLADPLFQRTLVGVVRSSPSLFSQAPDSASPSPSDGKTWTGLPIIADEVFTGLFRLGHRTACSLLGIHADISVHAKLLTGGLLPLAVTVASESIYEAFLSPNKTDALLHGHSYTAHAVGCAVANTSLDKLLQMEESGEWEVFRADWTATTEREAGAAREALTALGESNPVVRAGDDGVPATPPAWSVWSQSFVKQLSAVAAVDSVWALGSVLAIAMKDAQGSGYTSSAAVGLRQRLLVDMDGKGWNIHSRVLGNVLYLMTSQTTSLKDVGRWEGRLQDALEM